MTKQQGSRLALYALCATLLLTTANAQTQYADAEAATELAPIDAVALASAAPGAEAYPEDDIVVLQRRRYISLLSDGRVFRRVHKVQQLLTAWAVRRQSDLRVAWDSSRQDLIIHSCRTIMRDGTVVPTPDYGFNEVTPDAVARAADFLDIREMVISHVGTEIGCVTEIDYEIRDRQPPPLPASGIEYLQGEHPILRDEIVIESAQPLGTDLRHCADIDITFLPAAGNEDGTASIWTAQNVPGLPVEGNARRRADYLPHLIYSAATDWSAIARRWQSHNVGAAVITPELQAWLDQPPTTDGSAPLTDLDRVQDIAALVGNGVQTVHLPAGIWSRAPRPAVRVFATASGTPWEKGLLALTLLQAAGYAAEIGFFSLAEGFDHDLTPIGRPTHVRSLTPVAAVDSYRHIRVVVPVAGENYWIDPEHGEAFPGRCDLGGKTGLFFEEGLTQFRTYRVAPRSGTASLTIALRPRASSDEDGADVAFTADIDLACDGVLWSNDQEAREVAESLAAAVLYEGQATEVEIAEVSPFRLRLRVRAEGSALARTEGDRMVYALPQAPVGASEVLPQILRPEAASRQTPLYLPAEYRWQLRLDLELPDGWQVDYLPADRDLAAPAATCRMSCDAREQKVTVARELSLTTGWLHPEDYPEFQQIVAAALQPNAGLLVLRKD